MNPDLQQIQKQIDDLNAKLTMLYSTSTIPFNIENAFRERLNNPRIYTGIVAPAIIPKKIGDIYINTVLAKVYCATGLTSSSNWSVVN